MQGSEDFITIRIKMVRRGKNDSLNDSFSLSVPKKNTIKELKEAIAKDRSIRKHNSLAKFITLVDEQHLVFNGKVLNDDQYLNEIDKFQEGCSIILARKLIAHSLSNLYPENANLNSPLKESGSP